MKTTTLAERLKVALSAAGMSQKELAERIHVSQPSINKIVTGRTENPVKLVEMAIELGVRPEWLAINSGPMRSEQASENDGFDPPANNGAVFVPVWSGERQLNEYIAVPRELRSKTCRAYRLTRDSGFDDATAGSVIVVDTDEKPEVNDYVYATVHGSPSVYRFIPSESDGFLAPPHPMADLIPVGVAAKIIGVVMLISKRIK